MKHFLCLFLCVFAMSYMAESQTVKLYLENGQSKEYNINDIENLSFNNVTYNSLVKIYSGASNISFYTMTIDSITFSYLHADTCTVNIYRLGHNASFGISQIDSIIISPWQNPNFNYNNINVSISGVGWEYKNDSRHYYGGQLVDSSSTTTTAYTKIINSTISYNSYDNYYNVSIAHCNTCFDIIPVGYIWFCENKESLRGGPQAINDVCSNHVCSVTLDTVNSVIKLLSYSQTMQHRYQSYESSDCDNEDENETLQIKDIPYTIDANGDLNAELSLSVFDKISSYSYEDDTMTGMQSDNNISSIAFLKLIQPNSNAKITIKMTK